MIENRTINEALIQVFTDHSDEALELEDIYKIFQDYYKLSEHQLQEHYKYPQPNFHHEIRSLIDKLVKQGLILHVGRSLYKLSK